MIAEEVPGTSSRLEIDVREPAVKHTVTLAQLQGWANGATRSPVEKIKRERLRELLEAKFTHHEQRSLAIAPFLPRAQEPVLGVRLHCQREGGVSANETTRAAAIRRRRTVADP